MRCRTAAQLEAAVPFQGAGHFVGGSGFRAQGSGARVQGLGFRV